MYSPKSPPINPTTESLAAYTSDELQSVAQAQSAGRDFLQLNVLTKAPTRLKNGMVVCADGVTWQPLSAGGGFFGYFNGAWVKLNN